jgi:Protein of unknown function (DUF3551)
MSRIRYLMVSSTIVCAGIALTGTMARAEAQTARSYCLISPGGEPGGCGFPTLQACLIDSAGFGTCIATDYPAWGQPATAGATAATKRKR